MDEEGKSQSTLKKIATLGGQISFNKARSWMYGAGEKGLSKGRLFGAKGPMHIGMPHKEEMAIESSQGDTRRDLIKELEEKGINRREAEETVNTLIKKGLLREVYDSDLQETVLVRG